MKEICRDMWTIPDFMKKLMHRIVSFKTISHRVFFDLTMKISDQDINRCLLFLKILYAYDPIQVNCQLFRKLSF